MTRGAVGGPTDLTREDNWTGGFYELSMQLGAHDDARLDTALHALWAAAGLPRAFRRGASGSVPDGADVSAASLLAGPLRSIAAIPGLGSVVCAVFVVREESFETGETRYGADWLDLCLPLGALAHLDRRVGAYPFDDSSASRAWREPIERWFEDVARAVFGAVRFSSAVTGFEVSGMEPSEPGSGWVGVIAPDSAGGLSVSPVTRW